MREQEENDAPAKQPDPAATDDSSENGRNGARKRRDPNEPSAVVGLGASAGGVAVLQQFFADMPAETGTGLRGGDASFAGFESQLAAILQQKTPMPVMQVTEPVKVKPRSRLCDSAESSAHVSRTARSTLVPPQQALGRRVTIDLFFRTLAQAYGQRAVCVILSGTDSDGVIGLKHIRAQGGLTIAQDPNEAEHDSMPVTAISTGMVDWVLPVAKCRAEAAGVRRRTSTGCSCRRRFPEADEPDAKVKDAPGGETVSDETRDRRGRKRARRSAGSDLRAQTGHDFRHYKRATVLRRIARRMQVNSLESIPRYLDFIRTHPLGSARAPAGSAHRRHPFFPRSRRLRGARGKYSAAFRREKERKIRSASGWPGARRGRKPTRLRCCSANTANGWTIRPTIQIFATDIDEQAIADARDGFYPATIEADVSPERLRRFFGQDHGRYRVRKRSARRCCSPRIICSRMRRSRACDLISCRNLLIYLNAKAQEQVFDIFHFALRAAACFSSAARKITAGAVTFLASGCESTPFRAAFNAASESGKFRLFRSAPRRTDARGRPSGGRVRCPL